VISGWRGLFDNPARPELLVGLGVENSQWRLRQLRTSSLCIRRTGVPMCVAELEVCLDQATKGTHVFVEGYSLGYIFFGND
jgi:hypothetical protein